MFDNKCHRNCRKHILLNVRSNGSAGCHWHCCSPALLWSFYLWRRLHDDLTLGHVVSDARERLLFWFFQGDAGYLEDLGQSLNPCRLQSFTCGKGQSSLSLEACWVFSAITLVRSTRIIYQLLIMWLLTISATLSSSSSLVLLLYFNQRIKKIQWLEGKWIQVIYVYKNTLLMFTMANQNIYWGINSQIWKIKYKTEQIKTKTYKTEQKKYKIEQNQDLS